MSRYLGLILIGVVIIGSVIANFGKAVNAEQIVLGIGAFYGIITNSHESS